MMSKHNSVLLQQEILPKSRSNNTQICEEKTSGIGLLTLVNRQNRAREDPASQPSKSRQSTSRIAGGNTTTCRNPPVQHTAWVHTQLYSTRKDCDKFPRMGVWRHTFQSSDATYGNEWSHSPPEAQSVTPRTNGFFVWRLVSHDN